MNTPHFKYILILLLSFALTFVSSGQIVEGTPCTAACIDYNKSNLTGRMPNQNGFSPNLNLPCGSGTTEDNPGWWIIRPAGDNLTFSYTTSNCVPGKAGTFGIEITLWEGDICGNVAAVGCSVGTSGILTAPVNPCKIYYLQIDGVSECQCNVICTYDQNQILKEVPAASLVGPLQIPKGSKTRYSASLPSIIGCRPDDWKWTIDPASSGTATKIGGLSDDVDINIVNPPANGKVMLCCEPVFKGKCLPKTNKRCIEVDITNTLSATVYSNSPVCKGATLRLYASGGTSYIWEGPNGFNSKQQNPEISNFGTLERGTYSVTISDAAGRMASKQIIADFAISPSITLNTNSPVNTGNMIMLYASGGIKYLWVGPNGFISYQQNPQISNATKVNQGEYNVTVTGTNGCTAISKTNIVINSVSTNNNAPQKMSYQAIIRNSENNLVSNQQIGMKISIMRGAPGASAVYIETQTQKTNSNGLLSLEIGGGTAVSGSFSAIDWANGPYFAMVDSDPLGGSNYTITGVTQLLSVPYSMYAVISGINTPGPQGPPGSAGKDGSVGAQGSPGVGFIKGSLKNQILYWNGSGWVSLNPGMDNQNLTLCNGILTWAINGQCPGVISTLACSKVINSGALTEGIEATGVCSILSYSGGNGGGYLAQTVSSTGVKGLTATLLGGSFTTGTGWLTYNINGTPLGSGIASFELNIGGRSCILTRTVEQLYGEIITFECDKAVHNGILVAGMSASGISSSIYYTGGNGGIYKSHSVVSTGVTGLTATLTAGTFSKGVGLLTYSIDGTPSDIGTASFALKIGNQECILNREITNSCYLAGTVHCNGILTNIVDVINPITGRFWMDRNIGASRSAVSTTDANSYGDLFQWGRRADGHQCRNSGISTTISSGYKPDDGNFILSASKPFNWSKTQSSHLWRGVSGINNPCPIGYRIPTTAELNSERISWSSSSIADSFPSPLKLPKAGYRLNFDGKLYNVGNYGSYWSSEIPSTFPTNLYFNNNNAYMSEGYHANGFSVRCIKDNFDQGSIKTIGCNYIINAGNLVVGQTAAGVSSMVSYEGGNGKAFSKQSVNSTGVEGLTAILPYGNFETGSGILNYTISGIPRNTGTASFFLNIGGQTCILNRTVTIEGPRYPSGTVHCNLEPTDIIDIINPATGKIWMDRNLGATQVSGSSSDVLSFGDLYQWGRRADGHQCRNSFTTVTLSSTDRPSTSNYILTNSSPYDWRSPQNDSLWQGGVGFNNPCPIGYRIPTSAELDSERLSWGSNSISGAFNSPLKLSIAGSRNYSNGSININDGSYWSSSVISGNAHYLGLGGIQPTISNGYGRAYGRSVRCIKN